MTNKEIIQKVLKENCIKKRDYQWTVGLIEEALTLQKEEFEKMIIEIEDLICIISEDELSNWGKEYLLSKIKELTKIKEMGE